VFTGSGDFLILTTEDTEVHSAAYGRQPNSGVVPALGGLDISVTDSVYSRGGRDLATGRRPDSLELGLAHREAYARLHNLLVDEVAGPFSFLGVACGDASATVNALKETQVVHYHGIDVSRSALDSAEQPLRVLNCPVTLYESDFVQAMKDWRNPVQVVWVGLLLHHLCTPEN
jgi:hypothetical protein